MIVLTKCITRATLTNHGQLSLCSNLFGGQVLRLEKRIRTCILRQLEEIDKCYKTCPLVRMGP